MNKHIETGTVKTIFRSKGHVSHYLICTGHSSLDSSPLWTTEDTLLGACGLAALLQA